VSFWDAEFSTQLAKYQQHKADVLAIETTPSGNKVFATGVDAQVVEFTKLDEHLEMEEGFNKWTHTASKRPHTHDVRALAMAATSSAEDDGILISGGNDAQILAYNAGSYGKQHPVRVVEVRIRRCCSRSTRSGWTCGESVRVVNARIRRKG
jgi:U3 small nucleolar RNA-associated protein 4